MERQVDLSSAYRGGRVSGQRRAIAEAAAESGCAFTVEELVAAARRRSPRIGTATVYRAVAALHESGFIELVGMRDGRALYVHCGRESHHHHLVCTGCGAVTAAACPLDDDLLCETTANGYVVTSHEVTLYGLCPKCAKKAGG